MFRQETKTEPVLTCVTVQNLLDNLDDALAAKGWSQSELSRVTNIDRTLINRYCRGLAPTEANARKIMEVMQPHDESIRTPLKMVAANAA